MQFEAKNEADNRLLKMLADESLPPQTRSEAAQKVLATMLARAGQNEQQMATEGAVFKGNDD